MKRFSPDMWRRLISWGITVCVQRATRLKKDATCEPLVEESHPLCSPRYYFCMFKDTESPLWACSTHTREAFSFFYFTLFLSRTNLTVSVTTVKAVREDIVHFCHFAVTRISQGENINTALRTQVLQGINRGRFSFLSLYILFSCWLTLHLKYAMSAAADCHISFIVTFITMKRS